MRSSYLATRTIEFLWSAAYPLIRSTFRSVVKRATPPSISCQTAARKSPSRSLTFSLWPTRRSSCGQVIGDDVSSISDRVAETTCSIRRVSVTFSLPLYYLSTPLRGVCEHSIPFTIVRLSPWICPNLNSNIVQQLRLSNIISDLHTKKTVG